MTVAMCAVSCILLVYSFMAMSLEDNLGPDGGLSC